MNLVNSSMPCLVCGAPTRNLEDSKEQLLACSVCEWRQKPKSAAQPSRQITWHSIWSGGRPGNLSGSAGIVFHMRRPT